MTNTTLDKTAFRDERIDRLNSWQEALFHRILVACGEDGRLNADPSFIRSTLFPLKSDLRIAQVANALVTLDSVGLIALEKDIHGHPTSLTVSRDLTLMSDNENFSREGRRGGAGGTTGTTDNLINYLNQRGNEGNEGYETRKDELGDKPSWDTWDTESLDITEQEAETYRQNFAAVEAQARDFGLTTSIGAMQKAMELVSEYGLDFVLKAIAECIDVPYWRYVKAVLKAAKERGGSPGDAKKTEEKPNKWFNEEEFDPSIFEKCGKWE